MLEPDNLDPQEVLNHLKALGFNEITTKQLNDFLHDLKKLIKYEQKYGYISCGVSTTSKSHDTSSVCSCSELESTEKLSNNNSFTNSIISDYYSLPSSCSDTAHEELNEFSIESKEDENDKSTITKVQPSFIRPWTQSASKENSFNNRKNLDPVKLYHHYKELWNRNKIPGKSNHSQLRWFIRNKMLGQESHTKII
ncbi:conserved hypothetical protein [Pediculus humanus corporis]|uniref:Centriolar and ciliogenesis-associated protein HYLS1 C-terminal domain-containing protein n=1 Tax=Pediculus humanus subsp. corporis TaxID=121224 RepID=E0VZH6_PEDHC|nr:uncharacterized protein Phum_PHUM534160 [Pediculus humanus corporis]EEB18782.1 conserved hypothetical protein [Pediculus humanus corporis]